ncbi:MAG: DUF2125 domain-containing protein [Rhodospirillaceae bacterium]
MRKRLVILVIAVAVAAAGYAGFWFHTAGTLKDGIGRWAAAQRGAGWTVEWQDLAIGGFPFGYDATFTGPRYGRTGALGWTWEGERLTAALPLLGGDRVPLALPAASRILYRDGAADAVATINASAAAGEVRLAPDGTADRVSLFLADPRVEAGGAAYGARRLSIGVVAPEAAAPEAAAPADPRSPHAGPGVVATVEQLMLPAAARAPLGREIAHLDVEAQVLGQAPAAPLRQAAAAWRDGGGTLELRRLALHWGNLQLVADGTVALDRDMQPMGAATARIAGFNETIDALAANGAVNMRDAGTAKAALSMMARPAPDTGRPEIRVPLNVQQSQLFLGPFPLLRVPRIEW